MAPMQLMKELWAKDYIHVQNMYESEKYFVSFI